MSGGNDTSADGRPMTIGRFEIDYKLRRVYLLLGIAWLFHAVGDPVVTFLAVNVLDVAVETNPLLRGPLNQGAVPFALAHVPLFVMGLLVLVMFTILFDYAEGEERTRLYWLTLGGFSVIILWGIALVGWNLFVLISSV